MKHIRLALLVMVLVASPALGGVGISWTTGWGAYAHDAPNVVDDANYLLDSYSATWQLVYAGADGVVDPPDLDNAAYGYISGDDVVWAQRTIPLGGGTAPEDGTVWDRYLYPAAGDCAFVNFSWITPGFVYQRLYEGAPASATYYYDSPRLAFNPLWSEELSPEIFYAEADPYVGGFKPNKTIGGGDLALGVAVDAPQLVWTTGGDGFAGGWAPATFNTHDGVDAAAGTADGWSGYSSSWIETTVTGPIAVSFWWSLNVFGWGGLDFTMDGNTYGSLWSSDWQYAIYGIPAGTHTLRWTVYASYGYPYGGGSASGYLDQVTLQPVTPEIEVLGRDSSVITNGSTATSTTNGTDFGATFLTGATSNRAFYIRNAGTADLVVSNVTLTGVHNGDFQVISSPARVRPSTTSNLVIRFDPSALGERNARVIVENNDEDEGSYSFAISGTGIADGPNLRVYGDTSQGITNGSLAVTNALGTDFGTQYLTGFSTSRTFVVTNAGNSNMTLSAVQLAGSHLDDFSVDSYPAVLLPGAKSNLVIRFDPRALGVRSATLQVVSDDAETPVYSFAIGGTGVADVPDILVYGTNGQAILDGDVAVSAANGTYFGGTPVSSGAIDRVYTVTNSGAADLVLSQVSFAGAGAAHFSALAVPPVVDSRGCSNLTIRFAPTAAGVITAMVVIANNDSDENPYEFAVRGDGISTHYVWTNSPSSAPPFGSWETAARTIQAAVSNCVDGDVVWVTNGLYASGGIQLGGYSNRVAITNAITLRSVNGPEVTIIRGGAGIRGAYLGHGALLTGFTITNGQVSGFGAGVYGESSSAMVSNCIISGNVAANGGGIYQATTYDSLISGNTALDGGGGAWSATLHRCRLIGNQAGGDGSMNCCGWDPMFGECMQWANELYGGGGGAYQCSLNSCLLQGNSANAGGGAAFSSLTNCTFVANHSAGISSYALGGGGMIGGAAVNCIMVDNSDSSDPSKGDWDTYSGCYGGGISITYSCLTDPPSGIGNVTGQATFVAGTYRLAEGSLGIDAGSNAAVQETTDLAGNPRIGNGTVDMGAYEYMPHEILPDGDGDGIPDDWENTHGLNPAVSNSPTMNSDDDDQPDVNEYIADTHPTNGASYFPLVSITNPPIGTMVLVVNPSSPARVYGVRWTTNLLATPQIWTLLPPEKMGTGSAVTFTVTNDGPGRIYRTGVRVP